MVLPVIEDHFEEPFHLCEIGAKLGNSLIARQKRGRIAVMDALEVAVGRAADIPFVAPVSFVGLGEVDPDAVLSLVAVLDYVALVVIALADEPTEDSQRVCGV